MLASTEKNIKQSIYGQQNADKYWGGPPAVLIFGNNYQLMPFLAESAINGYERREAKKLGIKDIKSSYNKSTNQILVREGNRIFINDMTHNVFVLNATTE